MITSILAILKSGLMNVKVLIALAFIVVLIVAGLYKHSYDKKVIELQEKEMVVIQLKTQVDAIQSNMNNIEQLTKSFAKVDKDSSVIKQSIVELKQKQGVQKDEEVIHIANSISADFNTRMRDAETDSETE